jgi:GT2 family glycosyltransferase
MPLGFIHSGFGCIANAWLLVAMHFDAFRADPVAYLTATKWYLLRKRVRASGQFALLLGRSARAYTYWSIRDSRNRPSHSQTDLFPPIIGLVWTDNTERSLLDATVQSLAAEGIRAITATNPVKEATRVDWEARPWLLFMQAGDQLAPGAASAYRRAMQTTDAAVIYADDDLWDKWGRRTAPHFKPDWNSELFRYFDFLTGASIVRTDQETLTALSADPDAAARIVSEAVRSNGAFHLQEMLHHRVARPLPQTPPAPLRVSVDLPSVSVIIPTRNRLDLLRKCLEGLASTRYPAVEIIVVDNSSDDPDTLAFLSGLDPARIRLLRHPGHFNYSAINNQAAKEASGQLLCLLNNDIEVISPDWLEIMATQAMRSDVGAVGAQLVYPDGRIQHAGVALGLGNAAGHAHRLIHPQAEGYFRRHALPQFASAVTGACLVVSRDRFLSVGGLDENNFPVAFNDVDLCLRLNERGWQSLYEPRAALIHHESLSRGFDRDPVGAARFAKELAALQRIWKTDEIVDPYHHPQLSRASEQFAMEF